jgi:FtsP/CotA-like multicopper oxidase with cupredoxin domain
MRRTSAKGSWTAVACSSVTLRNRLALAALAAAASLALGAAQADDAIATKLLAEFRGAYPSSASRVTKERSFFLHAAAAQVEQIDGRRLDVWAYDGQVPGPVLRVRLGERVRVELANDLPQPTTIHWHGVRVPNAMDGVPGVTQPLIAPGERFVYRFTPKDAGTFWFHPHHHGSEQLERGLYGVLIVDDAKPLPWSRDVVWVIDDWLLGADGAIDPRFNTPHDLAHDGRWGNVTTVNGRRDETLTVRAGERIRLRLVNTANGRVFAPDFSSLDACVIAVDGLYTREPLDPRGFELAPGNRIDLDVTIRAADRGRSIAIVDRFTRNPIPLATIRVLDEVVRTPRFAAPSNPRVPHWTSATTAPVDVEYRLNARRGGEYGIEWTINDRAFAGHGQSPAGPFEQLEAGRWHRIRFVNESFRLHPMHVHGQFFKVIARGGAPVDEPFFRDTVLLKAKETIDVGMVPLERGPWMLHCHIQEHAEAGMMTVVEVK